MEAVPGKEQTAVDVDRHAAAGVPGDRHDRHVGRHRRTGLPADDVSGVAGGDGVVGVDPHPGPVTICPPIGVGHIIAVGQQDVLNPTEAIHPIREGSGESEVSPPSS